MTDIKNNVTGKVIDKDKIVSAQNGGILVAGKDIGTFTYVPEKEISYTPAKNIVSIDGPQKPLSYGSGIYTIDNDNQKLEQKTIYDFGIDSITARYTSPRTVSGFVSQAIELGPCSYITLSVKSAGKLDGRTEFSIIDGTAEVPILPEEMNHEIQYEKLFPNMPTRFSIDFGKDYVIYKNNAPTELTYEQVKTMALDDGEYAITYMAYGEYQKYFPNTHSIRLKIIARCPSGKPTPIKAMTIKKFGGEMPWPISD